jgi:MFS family permease
VAGYVAGRTVSDVGDQVWFIALGYAAARLGDPQTAALVIAAGTVPRALLMLVGGTVADRLDARRLMLAADAARVGVLVVGAVALATAPVVPVLVAVGLAFGVADAISDPAAATFPRRLVRRSELTRVAALRQLGGRAAVLAGAPLGGVVLATADLTGAMLTDAALFAVAALLLLIVRPRFPRTPAQRQPVLAAVRSGARYVRRTPRVLHLVVALSGLNVFVTPVTAIGLALRVTDEGWGPQLLGVLLGCLGAGAAVGTVATLRWSPGRPILVAQSVLLVQAAGIAAVGIAPLAGVVAAMVVVGITAGLASPLLAGTFQATVDDAYLGRVSSLLSLADDGLMPLALVAFGTLAAATGLAWACAVCGAGMAALMLAGLIRRDVRDLRPDGPAPDAG